MITLPNGRKIGPGQPCFIVAEIGQNHQGDVYTALRLIKAAVDAGADAVKFCKRHLPSELTAEAAAAPYTGPNSFGATYGEHRAALELSPHEYTHLKDRIRYNEWPILMFATVCDKQSVDELEAAIDPPMYKIASRDFDNWPLVEYVAKTGKPVFASLGMIQRTDAEERRDLAHSGRQCIPMICTSKYPILDSDVGLVGLHRLREYRGRPVGFSNHTPGIVAPQTAAALGACVVECHLTLSRSMRGSDHAASLETDGFKRLVRNIRAGEAMDAAWGQDAWERFRQATQAARDKLGRSLVSTVDIPRGAVIYEYMVTLKSPGHGVHWPDREQVIGHCAERDIPADVTIMMEDVV